MNRKSPRPSFSRRPSSDKKVEHGRKSRIRQRNTRVAVCVLLLLLVIPRCWCYCLWYPKGKSRRNRKKGKYSRHKVTAALKSGWSRGHLTVDVQLLAPNEYARPQLPLTEVKYIAIHYTANPGASAQANRDYFENLAHSSHETKVSSHFVVGLGRRSDPSVSPHQKCPMQPIPEMWIPYPLNAATRTIQGLLRGQPMIQW